LKIEEAGMRSGEKLKRQEKSSGGRVRGMEVEGKRSVCTGMKQGWIRVDWLRPGWYYFGRETTPESNTTQALKPVWQRALFRPIGRDRKLAGLSEWPSSEPCKAGAGGRLLQCDP
jgi:hypothetical protein